jgi:chromosome segregation ATPase
MTAYANGESYPVNVIHSLPTSSQDAGHEPNDSSHADGDPRSDTELKTAVSITSAQLGQDLRLVGSQLLSIETGHRALMERLQKIAAQVDERTLRQFELLQREDEGARQQILNVREDLEAVRSSFPEQLKIVRTQCESFGKQLQFSEQRFKEIEQEVRSAEDRIQKTAADQHHAVEQRLRATEPKILAAEQDRRLIDEWRQNADQHFNGINEQLQATVQRLQDIQQQLTDVVSQTKTFESQIKSCEDRVQRNTGLLVETKTTFDQQASRRENVEISIGSLAQQIEQLKAELSKVGDGRLKSLHAMFRSSRRMQTFAMVAWIMSLLLVGYIGIGSRGSSILTQYLSQWVPGLFI